MKRTTLQLPHDFFRPGKLAAEATCAFALPEAGSADAQSRLLPAVAFAIALARTHEESSVAIELRQGARSLLLRLETNPETTARRLLGSASEQLKAAAARTAHATSEASAAVTWLDGKGVPPGLEGAPLNLATTADGRGWLVYDSNRFRAETAQRLTREIVTLHHAMLERSDAPIARLPLLTKEERASIEARCTGAMRDFGPAFAHQLFEKHAAVAPQATALRFRDGTMSYGELNAEANRLAHALIARGIEREGRVMVCVEPSFDIAISLLAILKAGGVYVPLDPTYPQARIQALLADTKPALLLSTKALAEKLKLQGTPALYLDEDAVSDSPEGPGLRENPEREISAGQTAFIYYTSGTTGLPKGAMGSQGNLRHYLRSAQERYGICARDAMPAVARFSFSISMFELMSPLAAGGALVILDRDHVLDPARLSRTLCEVTLFHIGPSLLKTLLGYIEQHAGEGALFTNIRHASSGGDMVSAELLEQLKRVFPLAEVFVIYGCSEVSCLGCTFPALRERTIEKSYVGAPFDNTRVRILDKNLELCPAGVIGEIAIAGDGVVNGYLDRPELTREKFIEWEGHRYYRTGDMGRLSEDGFIEILGRRDFQVQLRGMRIELGEVEHHLRRAPFVREGVVVARESAEGDKALVAYFAGERDLSGNSRAARPAVRQYLREQLPEYMVPSVYVELDRLPLNHNLKIDRRALPEPRPDDRRIELAQPVSADFRDPVTPTEKHLAALWRSCLGLEKVGLADHFFDLGGDSLRAMALILRVDAEMGVLLDGLEVVRESLGTLAELCDLRRGVNRESATLLLQESAPIDPIELFHFGAEKSLYGVLHKPLTAASRTAALICAPLGAEATRANFVLQRLARQLALAGVATMRFDYFGHGDSMGDTVSGDCRRWEQDISWAHEELKRRAGATQTVVIGVRSGAALVAQMIDRMGATRWVLWDPVCDGAAYVDELTREQEHYMRNVRYRRRWQSIPLPHGRVELAGATYSAIAARQLRQLRLAAAGLLPIPLRWLESAPSPERHALFDTLAHLSKGSRLEEHEADHGWTDIERVEQTLPDVGISNRLAKMVLE